MPGASVPIELYDVGRPCGAGRRRSPARTAVVRAELRGAHVTGGSSVAVTWIRGSPATECGQRHNRASWRSEAVALRCKAHGQANHEASDEGGEAGLPLGLVATVGRVGVRAAAGGRASAHLLPAWRVGGASR